MATEDDLFDVFDGEVPQEEEEDVEVMPDVKAGVRSRTPSGDESTEEPPAKAARPSGEDSTEASPEEGEGRAEELMSEVTLEAYPSGENCLHECILPANWAKEKRLPKYEGEPAKTYPYTLDRFQSEAVSCLERSESVLVSAHTSAGKTTVAEYAIAMSMRDNQRVIYTSPIKALSNQKYRDLADEFGSDVGLMTGDVTINPNASCMIMTTEILRSMLYRGSDVCREVKWVIFDEVHYMRDRDRGVVWEETMILLPDTVRFVFLSATIPNAREFAEWICRIKHQPCHLIYTDYRPVPLQHYVYPSMGDGVYLTVDEKGKFREDNYGKAVEILEKNTEQASQSTKGLKSNKKKQQQHTKNSDLLKVVRMCSDRAYLPVIVFAFSKKECEQNALVLRNIDLVTQDEKALIGDVFENAMATLSPEDRELQQIQSMLGFLSRGIGIHHGGLLPILKEIVEILFQENLIKVLFCTETFAMGVNMPAKTVVFTSIQKWDGIERRTLNSGEYIQMAGRAGRRGKDDKGLVIIMLTDKVEPNTAKDMFLGDASRLDSQFYLGYNMLLNMLRLEGVDPNYLLERSFSQFQKDKGCIAAKEKHSELSHKLEDATEELNKVTAEASKKMNFDVKMALTDAFQADQELANAVEERRKILTLPKYAIPFMNPGRLISLSKNGDWAMVIKCDKLAEDKGAADLDNSYVVDCIDEEGIVRSVPLRALHKISRIRGQLPQAAQEAHNRTEAVKTQCKNMLKAILNHDNFKAHGLPELDPVNEMKIDGEEFSEVSKKMKNAENAKLSNRLMTVPQAERSQLMDLFTKRVHLHEEQTKCADILKNQNTVILRDELRSMKRVLRRLGFVDRNNVVLEKGKLACEISSCDEILLTELVFNNVFEGMSAEHIAALCSCLILDEKSEDATTPENADLAKALDKMKVIAQDVATVMAECKVAGVDTSTYVEDHIRPQLVPAVVAWMEGKPFKDIMQTVEMYEGSVVRVMRRLEELLRELGMAAKLIGHKELEEKMVEGRTKLRRGIVFSASLYL